MPDEPYNYFENDDSTEEYRRRQEAKAKRRKKRRTQRIVLLCAFALAAVLLVVCIVMIFKAIFKTKDDDSSVPENSLPVSEPYVPVQTGPGYDWPVAPDPDLWSLMLVNSQQPMPSEYDYSSLKVTGVGYYFDPRMFDSLIAMIEACNANEGYNLQIVSGWRSFDNQNKRRSEQIDQGASLEEPLNEDLVQGGCSDHHTGLAVDFITSTVQNTNESFAQTHEYQWLVDNAASYGFILRFPEGKEATTGIKFAPYHWRFIGVDDAVAMLNSPVPICLEEYLAVMAPPVEPEPQQPDQNDEGGEGEPDEGGSSEPGEE